MKKSLRLMALALVAIVLLASCSQDISPDKQQTPSIRGSVSIPSGAGFSGSDFFVQTMDGDTVVRVGKASSDGSFVISDLEEGKVYNVILTTVDPSSSKDVSRAASGYGGWLNNVTATVSEQVPTKPVAVRPLGTIRGNVRREGASDGYDTRVFIPGTSYSADTDEFGNYAISNVPQSENPYKLRFTAVGYSAKMVNVLLYSEADVENPEVTAPETTLYVNVGTLEGTARLSSKQDSTGISVMVQNSSFNKMGSTDKDGSFTIYDIKPGSYTVTISYPGYISQTVSYVSISESKTTTLPNTITLQQEAGSVSGSIFINDESDYSGVTVTVSGNGRSYSAVTDANGRYSVSVAQGNYDTVSFSRSCVVSKSLSKSIAVFSGNVFEMDTVGLESTHNYGLYESKESTCTEEGYKLYRCWNCSKEKKETLPLKDHEKNIIEKEDADCTHDGHIKYECSMCKQTLTETLPALGHDWGKPEIISASTCHDEGSQKVTCKTCGTEEIQTIEKLSHSWVDNGYTDGKIEYRCSNCGETEYHVDSTAILNISDWGSVSLKPSVDPESVRTLIIPSEIDGIKVTSVFEHTFQDCVNITKIVLPSTLKSIESWAFAGCSGITEIDLPASLERIGDQAFRGCTSLKSIVIPDGIEKIEYCTFYNCESLVSVTLPDSVAYLDRECFVGCGFDRFHIPETVETLSCYVFMNCKNLKEILIPKSVKYVDDRPFWDCTNLGTIYVQAQTQPSGWITSWHDCCDANIVWGYTGEIHYKHTESTEWKTSPTYHWHECTECGETMSMAKHEFTGKGTKEPSCTEDGVMTYTCSVCGWEYTEAIKAIGHEYESVVTKPATCTEKGEEKFTCKHCGDSYTQDIDPHHDYKEETTKAATCTVDGLKTLTCTACGDTKTAVIPATGHSYKETIVPATCTEKGTSIHKCEKCGDSYEEEIEPLGHNHVASITKQATCEEDGIRTYVCSRCSDSYTETIDAYGHYFTTSTIVQPATCFEPGLKSSKCFRCGMTVTEEIPKLEHVMVDVSDEANHWGECSLCGEILVSKKAHDFVESSGDFVCKDCGYSESSLYYQVDDNGVLTPKDKSILPSVVRIPSNIGGVSVTAIADRAFCNSSNIEEVYISSGITRIGKEAFDSCGNLEIVSLPDGLIFIGYAAFYNDGEVREVTIPETVKVLEASAFSGTGLTSVVIPKNLESIGVQAFRCSALVEVIIPKEIPEIPYGLFDLNRSLTSIVFEGTTEEWSLLKKGHSWRNEAPATAVVCSDGEVELGNYEVDSDGYFYVTDKSEVGKVFEVPSTVDGKTVTGIGECCFSDCHDLEKLILPDTVTKLKWYCLSGCTNLIEIENISNIIEIDYGVFYNCSALESLSLPNVKTWESDGATCCTSLTSVTISNSLRRIPKFNGCTSIEKIVFQGTTSEWNRLEKVDGWCADIAAEYVECTNGDIKIKETDGVYAITLDGILSCSDYSGLPSEYEVPSKIGSIKVKALANKTFASAHFTSVSIPEGVTSIGESCFENCSNLVSVSLPSTLKTISHWAFSNCTSLESVTIPNGVVDLHGTAFGGCTSLKNVQLSNSLTYLSGGSFGGCTSLASLVITPSVKDIHGGALSGSGLVSIEIPDTVKNIGGEAFQDCQSLEAVILSKNISEIPERLFRNCTSLKAIAFNGTVAKWNSLNKGSGWNEGVPVTKVVCIDGEVIL